MAYRAGRSRGRPERPAPGNGSMRDRTWRFRADGHQTRSLLPVACRRALGREPSPRSRGSPDRVRDAGKQTRLRRRIPQGAGPSYAEGRGVMPVWWEQAWDSALWVRHLPHRTRAAVIVLHGGPVLGHRPAHPWQLAALQMRPVLRSAASAVSLEEVLRALSELERLAGDVPVVLLGHATGGRAALRAAVHPHVRGVVALAPWLPVGEPVAQLAGRSVLLVQGDDGTAAWARAAGYVERALSGRPGRDGSRPAWWSVDDTTGRYLAPHRGSGRTSDAAAAGAGAPPGVGQSGSRRRAERLTGHFVGGVRGGGPGPGG